MRAYITEENVEPYCELCIKEFDKLEENISSVPELIRPDVLRIGAQLSEYLEDELGKAAMITAQHMNGKSDSDQPLEPTTSADRYRKVLLLLDDIDTNFLPKDHPFTRSLKSFKIQAREHLGISIDNNTDRQNFL